jgi:iron complex transport system permease protein
MALAMAFVLELSVGSVLIPVESILSILLGFGDPPEGWRQIVLLFRLPRSLAAMLCGAALGMAGLMMQTLFRNPLADPFVLGISSGASLGVAVLVMAVWGSGWPGLLKRAGTLGDLSLILSAMLGAMAVLAVVLVVARRVESNLTLLIVGIMFGYMSGALVSILMQFTHEQQIRAFISWTFGSFGGVTWRQMPSFAATLLSGLVLGWVLSKPLNGLLLGEGYARSMGIDVRRTRFRILFGGALLAGTVTAYCGPIGFLGIAIPHLCRLLLRTSDHHVLAPGVILLGATLALSADLISQMPGTRIVLPLNAVTALMGAPVVVAVLLRRSRAVEVAP